MVKSFRGQEVDISLLREKSGNTIAVGNMRVNAKGDLIGRGGRILKTREQLENEYVKNNPNAVKQKREDVIGFNKALAEYESNLLSAELAKEEYEKPLDPYKETSKHNKNLKTSKKETVKFTELINEKKSLDDLPLDDEFEPDFDVDK